MPKDLKYADAFTSSLCPIERPAGEFPQIDEVVSAFNFNIAMVGSLWMAMPILCYISHRHQFIGTSATFNLFGKAALTKEEASAKEIRDRLAAEMNKQEEELHQEDLKDPQRQWRLGLQNLLATVDENPSTLVVRGIETVLIAMLVNSWTAFEVLATDLWTNAINTEPSGLAELTGTPKRIEGTTVSRESNRDEEYDDQGSGSLNEKAVSLNDIHKLTRGSYDLTRRMGDLLGTRFRFISLRGIRRAYSTAFSEKIKGRTTTSIDTALADKSLDALSLVRNLIVHDAGVATEEYCRDSRGIPAAPVLKPGERLEVDGVFVRNLIEPVMGCCQNLIAGIDNWLTLSRNK